MTPQRSFRTRLGDSLAKRLWSGDVLDEGDRDAGVVDTASAAKTYRRSGWERTEPSITAAKEHNDGLRRGRVPEHIEDPLKGESRSFNPLSLRKLAKSEVIQAVVGTILGDLGAVPWSVVPIDEDASPSQSLISDAEAALSDINPNPESFDDINAMYARDLLEVGNCVGVTSLQIDGRRAEVRPLDPNTFTVDWDDHRVLEGFYQYPQADAAKWGEPDAFDVEEILWASYNPTTSRAGFYGFSPVEQVTQLINIMGGLVDKEITELEEGMPSGLIALSGDEWSGNDYDAFKTYWNEEVKGEQIKHPVAQGSAEFVPFNMSYKELQVLDRQQWYAKLVGSVFQVPMSETGLAIGQQMTRATDVSQRQRYKQKALRSLLRQLEDLWTYQYLHRWWSEDLRLEFDPGRDLIEKKEIAEIDKLKLESGVTTVNELREERGKDTVEWGDQPGTPATWGADGRVGSNGGQQSVEEANQNALTEGTRQNGSGDGGGTGFSDGGQGQATAANTTDRGAWLPLDAPVVGEKALRNTDDAHEFSFQPGDIEDLQADVEDLYGETIERVLNQVRENQELLRRPVETKGLANESAPYAEKSIPELTSLVNEALGVEFAQDLRDALVDAKREQVDTAEEDILAELEAAGLSLETVDVDATRDRVVERLQRRTLKVTKRISDRLEQDLRDVLTEGWIEGQSITEIEENIEDLSEKWTGHEAERLARDQIGRAAKEGRTEYAEETGDQVGGWNRTWLATGGRDGDGRTRDSHKLMHGETVGSGESWTVNYVPDGGPPNVEEDYPGASVWGIECRCDFRLSPAGLSPSIANSVQEWAADPSIRMREVAAEQDKPIGQVMVDAERSEESRTQAAKRLSISKQTYYSWCRDAGLID
jgi:phage portal protein BeeE